MNIFLMRFGFKLPHIALLDREVWGSNLDTRPGKPDMYMWYLSVLPCEEIQLVTDMVAFWLLGFIIKHRETNWSCAVPNWK